MSENADRPDDDLHDEPLSQLYQRLPGGEPRAETDAAIRRAAREAVTPRRTVPGASASWQRLLPLAAGVILAAGLLTFWHGTPPMPGAAKPLASAPAESAAPQAAPALPAPPAAPAPGAGPLAQAPESKHRYTAAPAAPAPQPADRSEGRSAEIDALAARDDRQAEAAANTKAAPRPALPAAPAPQEQFAGAAPAAPATGTVAAAPAAKMEASQSDTAPAHRSLLAIDPPWRRYMRLGDFDHARKLINHDIAMNSDPWARLDYDLLGLLTSTNENALLCGQDHGTPDQDGGPAQQACALLTDYHLGKANAAELDALATVLPAERAYWLAAARKLLKKQTQ